MLIFLRKLTSVGLSASLACCFVLGRATASSDNPQLDITCPDDNVVDLEKERPSKSLEESDDAQTRYASQMTLAQLRAATWVWVGHYMDGECTEIANNEGVKGSFGGSWDPKGHTWTHVYHSSQANPIGVCVAHAQPPNPAEFGVIYRQCKKNAVSAEDLSIAEAAIKAENPEITDDDTKAKLQKRFYYDPAVGGSGYHSKEVMYNVWPYDSHCNMDTFNKLVNITFTPDTSCKPTRAAVKPRYTHYKLDFMSTEELCTHPEYSKELPEEFKNRVCRKLGYMVLSDGQDETQAELALSGKTLRIEIAKTAEAYAEVQSLVNQGVHQLNLYRESKEGGPAGSSFQAYDEGVLLYDPGLKAYVGAYVRRYPGNLLAYLGVNNDLDFENQEAVLDKIMADFFIRIIEIDKLGPKEENGVDNLYGMQWPATVKSRKEQIALYEKRGWKLALDGKPIAKYRVHPAKQYKLEATKAQAEQFAAAD